MHTLLGLSTVLLVVLAAYLALGLLPRLDGWGRRREVQVIVLLAPLVSLGLSIAGVSHFVGHRCVVGMPLWDYALGLALPLVMGLIAFGGLMLGVVRLALMYRVVTHGGMHASADLQALVNGLADRLQTARPRLLLCIYDRPLALAYGIRRPTVLLSTWMIEHLDQRELESVLAHELGHVARRDYLVVWLATILRDAFVYLPTSWAAFRQLQHEKELACDELAVSVTNRPLALASALAKVWEHAPYVPALVPAQHLVQSNAAIEQRIQRLLATPRLSVSKWTECRTAIVTPRVGVGALVGLLTLQAANVAVMLAPMGCGPASLLGRWF